MHWSLKRGVNRILIVTSGAGIIVLTVATSGSVNSACLLGAPFGVLAGVLQQSALRADAAAFARTSTARDVRRVMTSSRAGIAAMPRDGSAARFYSSRRCCDRGRPT